MASEAGSIAVIGSGLIGLGIAAEAADRGFAVTVFEQRSAVGGATSPASFAWVNAEDKRPEAYEHLNALGRELHHASVAGDDAEPGFVPLPAVRLDGGGETGGPGPARRPRVELGGYVDLAARTAFLADRLTRAGGRTETGVRVLGILPGEHAPVLSLPGGERAFDLVVVAAGTDSAALLAPLDPGFAGLRAPDPEAARGFLIRARFDGVLDRIVLGDSANVRSDGPGRIAIQSLAVERELAAGRLGRDPETLWARVRPLAEAALGSPIPHNAFVSYDEAERPLTADGLPAIGFAAPRVYAAVTHSGVTLAPLVARLAAQELSGIEASELAAFRPARFSRSPALTPLSQEAR